MGTKLKHAHAQLWRNIKGEIVFCWIQEINRDIYVYINKWNIFMYPEVISVRCLSKRRSVRQRYSWRWGTREWISSSVNRFVKWRLRCKCVWELVCQTAAHLEHPFECLLFITHFHILLSKCCFNPHVHLPSIYACFVYFIFLMIDTKLMCGVLTWSLCKHYVSGILKWQIMYVC